MRRFPPGDGPSTGRGTAALLPLAAVAAAALPAACGGDGFSPPPPARVEGRWSYDATLSRPEGDCILSGAELRIEQDGDRFTGRVSEFSARCGDGLCRVAGAPLEEGRVSGKQVSFVFHGLRHSGEVVTDIMRGLVTGGSGRLPCVGDEDRAVTLDGERGNWKARL